MKLQKKAIQSILAYLIQKQGAEGLEKKLRKL